MTAKLEARPTEEGLDLSHAPEALHAILAGLAGAATVAVFFLVLDLMAGRALWTPAALGSRLILGEPLDADAGIPAILVLGYSAIHGTVFLGFSLIASHVIGWRRRPLDARGAVVLALLLFAGFQATFVSLGMLFMKGLLDELGIGRVAVANLLGAAAMAGYLWYARPRHD